MSLGLSFILLRSCSSEVTHLGMIRPQISLDQKNQLSAGVRGSQERHDMYVRQVWGPFLGARPSQQVTSSDALGGHLASWGSQEECVLLES